ncbi:hypothetical protein SAMN05421813_11245 [Daejeonella rubra]|uniref:Uncharacterized protein n=1 Tax=Daejeonella rubra TaxID=990371 RepID=A0A1G9T835_9SPHI|nr:hypothetical protein SAMN05421813_11245 [Daejeonella rubra]
MKKDKIMIWASVSIDIEKVWNFPSVSVFTDRFSFA